MSLSAQMTAPQPIYSYCIDPVSERAMCYSPNIPHITSDLAAVGTQGNARGNTSQANGRQRQPANAVPVAAEVKVEKASTQEDPALPVEVITPTSVTHVFDREEPSGTKKVSALSAIITRSSSSMSNPFATDFSFICGKGEPNPVHLRIYFPHCSTARKPLSVVVKREATVEEVIGYTLYEYVETKMLPVIDSNTGKASAWNLRIVEDDGTIDEDFPALERSRKVQKFSFDAFAICLANPKAAKAADQPKVSAAAKSATVQTIKKQAGGNYFIKVHLYSTLEVKQTTTVNLSGDMLLSEVLDICCKKRKIDSNDYTLKMADTKTDVPLDRTLESLGLEEICLLKKDRGPSAGDIFLRPPEETDQEEYEQPVYRSDEYTSVYKKFNVTRKMAKMMGRHERVLAIDGDYVYIMPPENKNLFDSVKTTSFHINSVVSCKQMKKSWPSFKMSVQRERDVKIYEFEAASPQEAFEICSKIHFMSQFNKPSAATPVKIE